jgi:hypothetical protein
MLLKAVCRHAFEMQQNRDNFDEVAKTVDNCPLVPKLSPGILTDKKRMVDLLNP